MKHAMLSKWQELANKGTTGLQVWCVIPGGLIWGTIISTSDYWNGVFEKVNLSTKDEKGNVVFKTLADIRGKKVDIDSPDDIEDITKLFMKGAIYFSGNKNNHVGLAQVVLDDVAAWSAGSLEEEF